jgi:hypothetical protein
MFSLYGGPFPKELIPVYEVKVMILPGVILPAIVDRIRSKFGDPKSNIGS